MPQLNVNGRALEFATVKQLFSTEVKTATQQAARDGQDNVVYRQGRDVFIASSPKNVNLLNVEPAAGLYRGSVASVGGQPVRLLAVSDELLSPMQKAVRTAEGLDREDRVPLAEQAYLRAVGHARTVDDALDVATSADIRDFYRATEAAYTRAIALAKTVDEARAVAAHAKGTGFWRAETQANQKAVSLL
jgi:hypothetical protein